MLDKLPPSTAKLFRSVVFLITQREHAQGTLKPLGVDRRISYLSDQCILILAPHKYWMSAPLPVDQLADIICDIIRSELADIAIHEFSQS